MQTSNKSALLLNFGETLKQTLACTRELVSCLERENEMLGHADPGGLENLNQEKIQMLVQLESLDRQRGKLLESLGYENDSDGMNACLTATPPALRLNEIWQSTREALQACQKQNQINGGAIELSRRYTQQTLSVLRGSVTDDLYNQKGHNYTKPDGRPLAKA